MGTVGRVPAVLALAAVVLTGCAPSAAVSSLPSEQGRGSVVAMTPGPAAGTGTPPAATPSAAPVVPGRTPSSGIAVRRATQSPSDDARIPVRVDYPAIGATLSVVSVGVTGDGAMELPDDSSVGGWYRHGSAPGDPEGTAVIASHSGSPRNPVGALYGLRQAAVGDEVTVTDAAGTARRYRVASTQSLGKGELDLSPYFRRDGAAELVLITCGGEWLPDEQDYTENIVTIATPVED